MCAEGYFQNWEVPAFQRYQTIVLWRQQGVFKAAKFRKTIILRTASLTVGMRCSEERLSCGWETNSWFFCPQRWFVFLPLPRFQNWASQDLPPVTIVSGENRQQVPGRGIHQSAPWKQYDQSGDIAAVVIASLYPVRALRTWDGFQGGHLPLTSKEEEKRRQRPRTGVEYGSVVEFAWRQ